MAQPPNKPPRRPPGPPVSVAAALMNFAGQAPRPPAAPAMARPSIDQALARGSESAKLAATLQRKEMLERELAVARLAAADHPRSAEHQIALARVLRDSGFRDEAIAAYRRAAELDPEAPAAKHLLAILGEGETPPNTPPAMVATLFDNYADKFDYELVEKLKYQGPWLIDEALRAARAGADPDAKLEILDLGCGTGLAAVPLARIASAIDGVDISARMIEKARARGIYRRVAVADLMEVLRRHVNAYDLLVAADVFTYFGDLAPALAAAYATLRPGGLFAFTTELGEGEGYSLTAGGHYRHTPGYVASAAAAAGFSVRVRNQGHLRLHHGTPTACETYVLAKP